MISHVFSAQDAQIPPPAPALEPVAHGLRSVYNTGNTGRCPYPDVWNVEVDAEDAKDANLMAVCAAIAGMVSALALAAVECR